MAHHRALMKSTSTHQRLMLYVVLVTVSAFVIYLCYHSEIRLLLPDNLHPSTSSETYQIHFHTTAREVQLPQNFSFVIKLLAYNRLESVSRCLESLSRAIYDNDRVKLHVLIDHFSLEGSQNADDLLKKSHEILEYVDRFEWKHGEKEIHYRTANAGLQAQWLEAWWPSSNDEFAFVVEDDLVLSPLFYTYVRALISTYYYDPANFDPSIYGVSLQRPRFVAGKHGNKLKVDNDTRLFLYQMVGTWGQLLFPKPWKEFRIWYDIHKSKGIEPILEGMVTTGWYRKLKQKIWTPWFIKFIHFRGYYNMYTNLLHERALSVSYRDAGVNYGKNIGPDSKLVNSSTNLDINLSEMKPLKYLDWYDFCFKKVIRNRFVKRLNDLESVLLSFKNQKTLTLVTLFESSEDVVRNLLCQFQTVGIRNYLVIGDRASLLQELSRRGHAVIDARQLIDDMVTLSLVDQKVVNHKGLMQAYVSAFIMKKSLILGYNVCFMTSNVLPVKNVFPLDSAETDITVSQINLHSRAELLCVASTKETIKFWSSFLSVLLSREISIMDNQRSEENILGYQLRIAIKGSTLTYKSLDDGFIKELLINKNTPNNSSLMKSSTKVVCWPSYSSLNTIKEQLLSLNLWMIDADLTCTSIVC